jgi:opacity protein-like surface antigen
MKIKPKTVWSMTIPLAGGVAGAAIGPAPAAAKGIEAQNQANHASPAIQQDRGTAFAQSAATPDLTQQPKLQRRSKAKATVPSNLVAQSPASPSDPTTPSTPGATDPTTPVTPSTPGATDPTTPTTPSTPGATDPTTPATPTTPGATDPNGLGTPATPGATDPSTPTTPSTPGATDPSRPGTPVTGSTPAVSAPAVNYFYVGGDFGGTQVDPFSVGRTNGDFRVENFRSAGYGVFVGYRMGDIRLEGEIFHTASAVSNGFAQGALATANVNGTTQNNAYMLNAYYDVPIGGVIKPYVGAGIGLMTSRFTGGATVATAGTGGNPATITNESYDGSKSGLAYQLKAGVAYALDAKTDLFFQFRYLSTPRNSAGVGQINDYSSQSFEGGLRIGL